MRRVLLAVLLLAGSLLYAQDQIQVFSGSQNNRPPLTSAQEKEFLRYTTFADRYFSAGDLPSALDQLTNADALVPNDPGILYNLSVVLLKLGRTSDAQEKIDIYNALYPEGAEAALVQAMQVNVDWVRDVQKRQQSNQTYLESFNRGRDQFASASYESALAAFRKAGEQKPDNAAAVYNEAICLEALGKYVDSIEGLKRYSALSKADDKAAIDQRIAALSAEVDDEAHGILCPFCGHKLPANATWCPFCWHGPYLNDAKTWEARRCDSGSSVTRSTSAGGSQSLSCMFKGQNLRDSLRYSRMRQSAIQQARKTEGWTYDGDLLASFKNSQGTELTILRPSEGVMRIASSTGDVLDFRGHKDESGMWVLDDADRVIDGQKFRIHYSYAGGRMSSETVRYQGNNICGHLIETVAEYRYEDGRLSSAELHGGYQGYVAEGSPETSWHGTIAWGYGPDGTLQSEALTVDRFEKTYPAKPSAAARKRVEALYPSMRAKKTEDLLGRGDACAIVGTQTIGDPIDLRPFDAVSPNLGVLLPAGVTRVNVTIAHQAAAN
ncbi:MAG: tetratricopeptide repeat protein [Acidobacteriota bacterium]